jgi:hypothetical protein
METAKNVVLEPLASALAVAAFLHNVIMAAQHHNATLCKEAWEKKLPAQVTQCTHYCYNNCDGNFFRSVGREWQLERRKLFYHLTKKGACYLKQTPFNY